MPMGADFSIGGGWRTRQAFDEFLKNLEIVASNEGESFLVVLEDCHEFYIHPRARYHFSKFTNLSHASVLVTTRPPYVARVVDDLRHWCGVDLDIKSTSPEETAYNLISSCISDGETKEAYHQIFRQFGKSLVALAAALYQGTKDENAFVGPELAFRAVREELDRIFDPESDLTLVGDLELLKTGLVTVWLLNAIECDFDDQALARLLNIRDVSALLRVMEASKEIFSIDDDGGYRSARHPAWGQLAMQAMAKYQRLELLSEGLQARIRTSANIPDTIPFEGLLTSFLFGVAFNRITPVEQLGYVSGSRNIHAEFSEAARLLFEHGSDRAGQLQNNHALLLQIVGNIRRTRPASAAERTKVLEQADNLLDMAIEIFRRENGTKNLSDLPGNILYERAYVLALCGDFAAAQEYFAISKKNDFAISGRHRFAVMSGVEEGLMMMYQGALNAAEKNLDTIFAKFEDLHDEKDEIGYQRIKGNLLNGYLHLAFFKRDASDARKTVELVMEACWSSPGLMDTFSLMKESVFHAENEDPVPDGILGTTGCAGASWPERRKSGTGV